MRQARQLPSDHRPGERSEHRCIRSSGRCASGTCRPSQSDIVVALAVMAIGLGDPLRSGTVSMSQTMTLAPMVVVYSLARACTSLAQRACANRHDYWRMQCRHVTARSSASHDHGAIPWMINDPIISHDNGNGSRSQAHTSPLGAFEEQISTRGHCPAHVLLLCRFGALPLAALPR